MPETPDNKLSRILIVDDHDLVRHGFKSLLNGQDHIEVLDALDSGEAAISWCHDNKGEVDVILMDVNMPGIGGIEATHRISNSYPHIGIIIVTVHEDGPLTKQLLNGGARGYLTKGNGVDEMITAIREVHKGNHYIAPDIAQKMALSVLPGEKNPVDALARRELQVFMMIAEGKKNQKISEILNLSVKTVSTYRARIYEKLDVSTDTELLRLAIKYNLVDINTL